METIELLAIIQKRAMEAGSQKALALEMRISPGYLSEVSSQAFKAYDLPVAELSRQLRTDFPALAQNDEAHRRDAAGGPSGGADCSAA